MKRLNIESPVAIGTTLLILLAPKFCCWSSAIAAISVGVSYLAWVYPMRPYLFSLSILSIGYSFYKVYRPQVKLGRNENEVNFQCNKGKSTFLSSRFLTWLTAIFVLIMFVLSGSFNG